MIVASTMAFAKMSWVLKESKEKITNKFHNPELYM